MVTVSLMLCCCGFCEGQRECASQIDFGPVASAIAFFFQVHPLFFRNVLCTAVGEGRCGVSHRCKLFSLQFLPFGSRVRLKWCSTEKIEKPVCRGFSGLLFFCCLPFSCSLSSPSSESAFLARCRFTKFTWCVPVTGYGSSGKLCEYAYSNKHEKKTNEGPLPPPPPTTSSVSNGMSGQWSND